VSASHQASPHSQYVQSSLVTQHPAGDEPRWIVLTAQHPVKRPASLLSAARRAGGMLRQPIVDEADVSVLSQSCRAAIAQERLASPPRPRSTCALIGVDGVNMDVFTASSKSRSIADRIRHIARASAAGPWSRPSSYARTRSVLVTSIPAVI
jgi:hypothetical protein